ncbi:hypothetical protein [Thiocapsa marina]|uniref:Uncharacterized protein n=1 Tax=Thiocapsa marina 5811 TaxID=768671 RepID=F9U6S6_9GAMM|nr:hypothetical protein [Thiocapsa marina]EGV19952.1 hypothetical protein ThimaDRAFT_0628 [Thiocapsa marina 5811]
MLMLQRSRRLYRRPEEHTRIAFGLDHGSDRILFSAEYPQAMKPDKARRSHFDAAEIDLRDLGGSEDRRLLPDHHRRSR